MCREDSKKYILDCIYAVKDEEMCGGKWRLNSEENPSLSIDRSESILFYGI